MTEYERMIKEYFENVYVICDLIRRCADEDYDDGSEVDYVMQVAEDLVKKNLKAGNDYTKEYNSALDYAAEKFPYLAEYHRI